MVRARSQNGEAMTVTQVFKIQSQEEIFLFPSLRRSTPVFYIYPTYPEEKGLSCEEAESGEQRLLW